MSAPGWTLGEHQDIKKCPFCAEDIKFEAIKCKHCGEMLSSGDNISTRPLHQVSSTPTRSEGIHYKRLTAALLAIVLGTLGIHRFYLKQTGWGVVYLLTCITLIPTILGIIEGIMFLTMSDRDFTEKFGDTL